MSIDPLKETKRLLFQSCKDGSLATVQQLLTRHSNLRAQINSLTDDDGNTILIIASENGHTGIVKLLLECGANVDHKNLRGWTALMKASENGDSELEIINLLLAHNTHAQVDLQSNEGYTALMVAAQNGQVKLATKLVQEHGASVHVGLQQEYSSWTALMEASKSGSIDIVKLLLEHGADDLGWALVPAILNKHNDIIELLLKHGAQVDDKNWSIYLSQPPLVEAVRNGDADVVKLLLEHGAKQGKNSAMIDAIFNKNAEIIRILSGHGARVDEMAWSDHPLLVEAVDKGDAYIVKLLLEHGAKQEIDRAITDAIFNKNTEIIQILSEHGAQVDEDCFDALIEAVEKGDADIVKLLLEHGAKQEIDRAITDAIFNKNTEIIQILSEHGAQVDEDCFDALIEAVEKGDADIVELLLEHGATHEIEYAMSRAIWNEQTEIIQTLSDHGAQIDDDSYEDGVDEEPDLVTACEIGNLNVAKLLLEHGAKDSKYPGWALTEAILNKHTEVIDLLLEHGVCVADDGNRLDSDKNPALVEASENGDIESVKLLLKYGEKEEYQDHLGWALSKATTPELFALLLDSGAEIDVMNELDMSPLVYASSAGNIEAIKLMLNHGAKKFLPEALIGAIVNKHTDIVELLIQYGHGAQVDDESWFDFQLYEMPCLVRASMMGDIETVKLLLKYGAEKNLDWALEAASRAGHLKIIKLLWKFGIQVDDQNMFDTAALVEASRNGHAAAVSFLFEQGVIGGLGLAIRAASFGGYVTILQFLIEYGDAEDLGYALIEASRSGHTEIIRFLLEHDVFVDFQDKEQTTALIVASQNGNIEAIKLLIELQSSINIQNEKGLSALMAACQNHHRKAVNVLLNYVALVNMEDDNGVSALMIVSQNSDTKIAKLLLAYGAQVDLQNAEGCSPLMKASQEGHTKVVRLLLKHGANVNLQDNNGHHSLMAACQTNHTDVVKLLLNHRADINLEDKNGQTAAKFTNNDDIIALFAANIGDDKFDAIESEVDLHEEVQLTQEEETHLIAIENAIIETGTLDHTLLHGVFVGPPRSGKDSVMKRLLGEIAPNTSPSTGAVETAIHVKVEESCTYAATIGNSKWTRLEYDEEALHLMKTTSSNNSTSYAISIQGEESTDTQIPDPPSAVKDSTLDSFNNAQQRTIHMQTDNSSEIQPESDPQPVAFQDDTSFQVDKIERTHRKSKHKAPIDIFKEAIKKKGLEGLIKQLTNSWSLYLTNTGGQMEFQELLPLLVSGPSMFFITFQLHKDLKECFQVEYELPSGESSKCYQSSLSILDSILQTLSTIAAMGTFVYKGLQKKCVPLKPKVFLIGTHKDQLDNKSAATIINNIDAQLQKVIKSTSHYREGIIQFASESQMIFTVNNHDPSDSDFQTIRSAVDKTVEKGDYKMESPAHWMIYSLVVRQLKNRVESYDECFAIAKECGIKDENEFNEALHFIHTKMGLVRYFPHEGLKDIVIVDPQILFEKVTELIVETFTFENLLDHSKLEAFEHMGIFDLSDFTKISSRIGQKLTPTLFAKLLEYLRIAARFQQDGETKYFLPCVLTHAQVKQNVYSSTIPQLIATFQCGYCPKGLFGTLITYLINNEMQSDFEWELNTENIYRDEVCFQVGPYDTVTIRFMPTHLQISCAESNPDLSRINCTQEDICQEVRESVEKGIKTVTSAINYINAQHSFTFYCTSDVCSKDPHPSKLEKHREKLCTLWCEKLNKPFSLPSGYEKWQLCSTEVCHSLKERLNQHHFSLLIEQLSNYATKWREIGTFLKFKQEELDIIQDKPYLQSSAPISWLSALISNWMQWAPGDSRGSTTYANLEDLKSAVSKAGLGVVADELSLVAAGERDQSTDTGRKRNSSSAAESSSKRPRL
jgi:ankyrin repeat protein/GTPase SAR1 family protein